MALEYWILLGWAFVLLWVPFVILTNRKEQPAVLFWLFMVELWERFSYYGMRAFLVLYLTKSVVTGGFGIDKKVAYGIYAAYGALVYLTPLAGGFLADKILGFRRAIIWGAILMAAGQFTLSMSPGTAFVSKTQHEARLEVGETDEAIAAGRTPQRGNETLMFVGLSLLVIGNGFFKPNISSMIGRFYPQGDPRRDRAFTIFYMGINTGAFIAPLTCGFVAETQGWQYGFLLAGMGMVTGLLIFLYTSSRGYLQNYGDPPPQADGTPTPLGKVLPVILGTLIAVPIAVFLIRPNESIDARLQDGLRWLIARFTDDAPDVSHFSIMDLLLGFAGLFTVAFMMRLSFTYEVAERQRIWVIVILLFFTTVFWGFFELAGSALNVFTDENVDKKVFGSEVPASVFQAVNAFFIMVFAPVFTVMWGYLSRRGIEPAAPVKFAIGLLLLGLGFLVLNLGKGAAVAGIMPLIFLILLYLFHTLGELALSPVGLSLVTKLAPARIVGFMMGFWFLSSAIAHQAGKWIAGATAVDSKAPAEVRLEKSLEVFNQVGLFAIGCGVFLLVISPVIRRWMHGIR